MPAAEITALLDLADAPPENAPLRGRAVAGVLFPESALEAAVERLGAELVGPDLDHPEMAAVVARHAEAGGVRFLADSLTCPVINAGDGAHENPVRALADALTVRRRFGRIRGLVVVLCAFVRVVASPTLLPPEIDRLGAEVHHVATTGLKGADAVLTYPLLDTGRAVGALVPSVREFEHFYGIEDERVIGEPSDDVRVAVLMACLDHVTREVPQ
jgi:aspartate carbamoyltransferase catalytic subunit